MDESIDTEAELGVGHRDDDRRGVTPERKDEVQANGSIEVDWEALARSTAHSLRISILEILGLDGGRTMSPSEIKEELQLPLSNTNYHVTELAKAGLIELVRTCPARGATEHFYRLAPPGA